MLNLRDATLAELADHAYQGYESWGAILEEDGQKVGQIFLAKALGQVFGHGTECHSKDKTGAARLWLRARKKAREWGFGEVWVHIPEDDKTMLPFWEKHGFTKVMTMYLGKIKEVD